MLWSAAMSQATAPPIRFDALLLRPKQPAGARWRFLRVPKAASQRLPTRGLVTVDGTLDGAPFQATLAPDGEGSHWLRVAPALCQAAGAAAGDTVSVAMQPVAEEPQPRVPSDLRQALAALPAAKAQWQTLTAVARRDWIHWISSGKKAETRAKRIAVTCDKLACGQRRACCFDRSGQYSRGNLGAPEAAD